MNTNIVYSGSCKTNHVIVNTNIVYSGSCKTNHVIVNTNIVYSGFYSIARIFRYFNGNFRQFNFVFIGTFAILFEEGKTNTLKLHLSKK